MARVFASRRKQRSSFETLEARRQFSASQIADFEGLPRQVTQLGRNLYFALDEKVDGVLNYVDLVGYDLKTGKRTSITRADGNPFGDVEYSLSKLGDRLVIAEHYFGSGSRVFELWSLLPGQTRATRLLPQRVQIEPESIVRVGDQTCFFASKVGGSREVYAIGNNDASARTLYTAASFGDKINTMHAFAGGLAFSIGGEGWGLSDSAAVYIASAPGASPHRVTALPKAADNAYVNGSAGGYLVLSAKVGTETRSYATLNGQTLTGLAAFSRAPITLATPMSDTLPLVYLESSNGVDETHTSIQLNLLTGERSEINGLDKARFQTLASSIYASAYLPSPLRDAEAKGGYAPSGADSYYSGDPGDPAYDSFITQINTTDNAHVELRVAGGEYQGNADNISRSPAAYDVQVAAGDYVRAGDVTYFAQSDGYSIYANNSSFRELWSTDGTQAGTFKITNIAAGPFVYKNVVYYVPSMISSQLVRLNPDIGVFEGRVVIDPNAAKQITPDMDSLRGRRVYVDLNGNEKFDKKIDLSAMTDYLGRYRIDRVPAGKRTIRISSEAGWEATRGWSKTVNVSAGTARIVSFGLRDILQSGTIYGMTGAGAVGRRVWIDLDQDSVRDANEPSQVIKQRSGVYRYTFHNVSAGNYKLVVSDAPNSDFGVAYYFTLAPGKKVRTDI